MGLDWIRLPKPRPGFEHEHRSLRAKAAAIHFDLDQIAWVIDWASETDDLTPEEIEVMLRLDAISVYPQETWDAFIADVWSEARDSLTVRPHLPLPADDRALLSCPSFADAMDLLVERFPDAEFKRYDHLDDLLGNCRWSLTRYTARELHLLDNGFDMGSVWRGFSLAPGVWGPVDCIVDRDSTAEQCRLSASLLRHTVCREVRRIVPVLASRDDEQIEAEFNRWGEQRWRSWQKVLDVCPLPTPPWVDGLAALDEAAERAMEQGAFVYGETPTTEMMERGIDAFGVARWLDFWGSRGHGFVRSA
jgi:hypothetical protein